MERNAQPPVYLGFGLIWRLRGAQPLHSVCREIQASQLLAESPLSIPGTTDASERILGLFPESGLNNDDSNRLTQLSEALHLENGKDNFFLFSPKKGATEGGGVLSDLTS